MQFPHISYETWLNKVKKELKTESLESHLVDIEPDLQTNPFFERKPVNGRHTRQESWWKIKQLFDGNNVSNADILRSLEGGINYVEIQQSESISKLSLLLENVELEFIHLHLCFSSDTSPEKIQSVLGDFTENSSVSYHLIGKRVYLPSAKFRFTSGMEGNLIDDLTKNCESIIATIDSAEDEADLQNIASNIQFERYLSTDIIREIAIHKAVNILWQNILRGFDLTDIQWETFASCNPPSNQDLENKYISLSSKGLTATIAGYSTIYIAPASTDRRDFHERISRNIHHLLQSESFLQKSSNGMRGSYQIEHIAREIAEKVWENIGRN